MLSYFRFLSESDDFGQLLNPEEVHQMCNIDGSGCHGFPAIDPKSSLDSTKQEVEPENKEPSFIQTATKNEFREPSGDSNLSAQYRARIYDSVLKDTNMRAMDIQTREPVPMPATISSDDSKFTHSHVLRGIFKIPGRGIFF